MNNINLNWYSLGLIFGFLLLAFIPPFGLGNIITASLVAGFNCWTIQRAQRKPWINQFVTRNERLRLLKLNAFLAVIYVCIETLWLIGEVGGNLASVDAIIWAIFECCTLLSFAYSAFQINIELTNSSATSANTSGNEGFMTRLIKARHYRQSI